jgi:hypothetical protein
VANKALIRSITKGHPPHPGALWRHSSARQCLPGRHPWQQPRESLLLMRPRMHSCTNKQRHQRNQGCYLSVGRHKGHRRQALASQPGRHPHAPTNAEGHNLPSDPSGQRCQYVAFAHAVLASPPITTKIRAAEMNYLSNFPLGR